MRAVLWDMDGTLVDSEKLWDVSMHELYGRLGGVMTPEVREATVGGSAGSVMQAVYDDLGLDLDPAAMAESADWLHDRTGELFEAGLPWRPGARELLDALLADGVPMALVTNTRRGLTEQALKSIGKHYFSASVCGDRRVVHAKPAPDAYLRAAELLGFAPEQCLAIEDSVTGTAAAEPRAAQSWSCPTTSTFRAARAVVTWRRSPTSRCPRLRAVRELLCEGSERIKQ